MEVINERTNSSPTQCAYLVTLFENGGTITDFEAKMQGIGRLSARICELKKQGYKIQSIKKSGQSRFGKTHYNEYFIAKEQEA